MMYLEIKYKPIKGMNKVNDFVIRHFHDYKI